jgi:pimeloyl-ACP methyl ester carboxylesterase
MGTPPSLRRTPWALLGLLLLSAGAGFPCAKGGEALPADGSEAVHAAKPLPPGQPSLGPGGAEYVHKAVRETRRGEGGEEFWLFEPDQPVAKRAPVILFLHGFSVMEPDGYTGWIEHLVRRGNIVIYPRWQASLREHPERFHPNVLAAMRQALAVLQEDQRTPADLQRFAVVGHSAGAVLAMKYAAAALENELPAPKAAVILQPGQGPKNGVPILPLPEAAKVPPDLKLIVAVGDVDYIVGEVSARRIWREMAALPERVFVTVRSDRHGDPQLRAGHLSPMSAELEMSDNLDWRGWWRLLDVACESAFQGRKLTIDPAMGAWSDGRPVVPLRVELP